LIRVPVLVWVVAAGASWACAVGPGPSVVKAAVSVFVAVVLYLGLLILIRRDLMGDLAQELPPRIRRYVLREKSVPLPAAAN
jgi:hypothetical protein